MRTLPAYALPRALSIAMRGAVVALTLVTLIGAALPAHAARTVLTTEPRTDLRTGPSAQHNRITVLPPGIQLWADDLVAGFYRVPLAPTLTAWVADDHVRPLDRSTPRPPTVTVRDISVQGIDPGSLATIRMSRPVAFRVRQQVSPPRLILDLFGVALARYGVRQLPSDRSVWSITADQVADGWAQLSFDLTFAQQRGWSVSQRDGEFQFLVRRPYEGASLANKVIVLDPGHGGGDSGAVGPTGLREKDVNLRIAMQLAANLRERGATVRLVRESDRSVGPTGASQRSELEARLSASEQPDADFFLSIHNNAVGSGNARSAYGTETYYWTPMSALPARLLQNALCARLNTRNRFISWRPFYVLRWGDVPRVLVECAYVSNPTEEQRLRSDAFVTDSALALTEGLEEFFRRSAAY